MSVPRLEWLRLWRTARLLVLVLVFAFVGLLGPLTAAYLPELIDLAGQTEGVVIEVPDPVPADGIAQYIANVSQLGLIAVAAVAALALAVDARPGLAAFYRTRQPAASARILPRWLATWVASSVAWTVGLLAAAYETVLLIGPLPVAGVVVGWGLWVLYLAFAVAVVALAAALLRSTVAVTVLSVGLLLGVALVGLVPQVEAWLPSALVSAPTALVAETAEPGDYLRAALVASGATVAALAGAVALADRREL